MNKISFFIQPQKRLPAYGVFLSLGTFITFIIMMSSPSDPKNAIFLGYSLERILLGAGILIPAFALLVVTGNLFRKPEHSLRLWAFLEERSTVALLLSLVVFIFNWILLFMPSYRLGSLAGYVEKLYPVIGWLAVIGAVTSALLLVERKDKSVGFSVADRGVLRIASIVAGIFALLVLTISITGLGIRYPADYWYGAGVPMLGLQILFSLFVGVIFLLVDQKLESFRPARFDLFIFIALWIGAAWFWAQEPIAANYFMPDTADNVIYPYSDGATFDTGAQFALIGQGIFNGVFFERSLYSVFLVYLHMLLGQDFTLLMTAQAALFAVLPALIYLIGRELHSRALGIAAGILLAIRGVNAIAAAKWIDTASPKMVLTDFPTAIGIAIFLLLVLKWFKEPNQVGRLAWAGAVFVLTFMLRSNVLTLLPVMMVLTPFLLKINWKQYILAGLIVLLGLFAVTLPWELRNQARGIPMYSMYYSRILIVLQNRYGIGGDAYLPSHDGHFANVRGMARQRLALADESTCDSLPCSILNHFLHNTVTSFVSLPSSLVLDDLWNTIKADTPYWKQDWNSGTIGMMGAALLLINLAMISLGAGSVWGRAKIITLVPIAVLVIYLLTNSLGLTSGGRYVAPVDWIVYLFYIAGGLQLVEWFLRAAGIITETVVKQETIASLPPLEWKTIFNILPSLALILAIGTLLPISELFFQPRYQTRQPEEILARLEETGMLEQTDFSHDDLLAFLSQPNAIIREGRALYPRYYPSGEGEQDRSTYYRYLDYQRLAFTLIGPYSVLAEGVVIPGFAPPVSIHAADVVVVGCWNTTYYAPFIDAVVVFSLSDEGYVYNRAPEASLQCPLPEPK